MHKVIMQFYSNKSEEHIRQVMDGIINYGPIDDLTPPSKHDDDLMAITQLDINEVEIAEAETDEIKMDRTVPGDELIHFTKYVDRFSLEIYGKPYDALDNKLLEINVLWAVVSSLYAEKAMNEFEAKRRVKEYIYFNEDGTLYMTTRNKPAGFEDQTDRIVVYTDGSMIMDRLLDKLGFHGPSNNETEK